jgi:hypothetical protein
MKNILFRSALIFDEDSEHLRSGDVLVPDGVICDVSYDRCELGDRVNLINCEGKNQARGISIIMKAGRFEKRQRHS